MSVLPSSPKTSACASPISRPDPSPRRVSPTATSPSRSPKAMIEARGLVKRYGSTMAVNDLSSPSGPAWSPASSARTAPRRPPPCG